jgi:hypothetical protein
MSFSVSLKNTVKKRILLVLAVLVFGFVASGAQAEVSWQGYMFGDYYYAAEHHNPDIKNANGFWFRRIYSTWDFTLSDTFKGRLNLEMADIGDFTSKAKMSPYVKDAYLQAKIGGQTLIAGISGSPSIGGIESLWGYRHLEKTPLDLFNMGTSREFGVALKGGEATYYHIMFANGNATSSESDKGKKLLGSFGFRPAKGLLLEIYADHEWDFRKGQNYSVLQGLLGYESRWGRTGFLYANRHSRNGDIEKDYGIFSGFVIVNASSSVEIIVRFDKLFNEPINKTISYTPFSTGAMVNFLITAVSLHVANSVWLVPNVKYAFYEDGTLGKKPGDDIYLNITFWWKF